MTTARKPSAPLETATFFVAADVPTPKRTAHAYAKCLDAQRDATDARFDAIQRRQGRDWRLAHLLQQPSTSSGARDADTSQGIHISRIDCSESAGSMQFLNRDWSRWGELWGA